MQLINAPGNIFVDGNPSSGQLGTPLYAAWHNAVQGELANFVTAAGLTLNANDNTQLQQALAARLVTGIPLVDKGVVNAYAATNVVPLTAQTLVHGVRQRVTIGVTNSGASTYSPDGLPVKPIFGLGLQALQGLELLATQVADLEYVVAASVNGGSGAWLLLRCAGGAQQLASGTYGATPPQFDSSTKLANMAAVQRALGNMAGYVAFGTSQALVAAHTGKPIILTGSAALQMTLPPGASVGVGATIKLVNGCTVAASGVPATGDKLYTQAIVQVASVTVPPASTIDFLFDGTEWRVTGGSAALLLGDGVFAASLSTAGYEKMPNGRFLMWTTCSSSGSANISFSWPTQFPTGVLSTLAISQGYYSGYYGVGTTSKTGGSVQMSAATSGNTFNVWGIGN